MSWVDNGDICSIAGSKGARMSGAASAAMGANSKGAKDGRIVDMMFILIDTGDLRGAALAEEWSGVALE